MKKIILTFTLLIVAVNISFAQDNKVDGKGLRKGEWFIAYTGDFQFYDYMDKLLNLDKMLNSENETDKEEDYRFFEKVSYKKGIKQGEFSVYSARKNNQGKYPQIAAGEYKDGKINGNLIFLNYGNQKRICYAVYEDGKIKDQDIVIEEKLNYYDEIYETFGSQKVYPIIKMKDGVCIEETVTVLDKYRLARFVKTDKGFTRYLYGRNMLRSGIIDLSYCLEVAELDTNFKFSGLVSIYEQTKIPFDTTLLNYRATYKNGKINGSAYWYDAKTGNAMMECNYVDGLLNGVAKLKAASGQTYVEASYKDGLLNGKYVTYFLNDGSNLILKGPFCEETKNKDIFQIAESNATQDIFKETIPMLKKEGHTIVTDGVFKFYEATYINGIINGKNNYYHSNGKKLYEGTVSDCKEVDWKWFDINGKVIYDKKEADALLEEFYTKLNDYNKKQASNNSSNNNRQTEKPSVFFIKNGELKEKRDDGAYYSTSTFSSNIDGTVLGFTQGKWAGANVVIYWTNKNEAFICKLRSSGGWSSKSDLSCQCLTNDNGITNISFSGDNTVIISCNNGRTYKKTPNSESNY
ncbi:hypothetical protein N9E20_00775 [Crocinitomicaceae bacterium]|nr:hypothetical protein [Crocinitomicaceae bacterium]